MITSPASKIWGKGRASRLSPASCPGVAALAELRTLQDEVPGLARPATRVPGPNPGTAGLLEEVCALDVDLDALDVELPRGFGRD